MSVRVQLLTECTTKLELGSCARSLYDWEGNEVKRLDDGRFHLNLLFSQFNLI